MGIKLTKLPELYPENLTESEFHLWLLLREREECIQELKDEIARLKGEKGKPKIQPSRLEPEQKTQESPGASKEDSQKQKKRPGSAKRKKTAELVIQETKVIQPTQEIPPSSEFKGYKDYTVQELIIGTHNTRYRKRDLENPNGRIPEGKATRRSKKPGTLWSDAQKLPSLSIPSLPCQPTQAP